MERILIFARIAGNSGRARWRVDPVAHAVAEADRVGDHHVAGRAVVADRDRPVCRGAAAAKVVRAEVDPAGADLAVIDEAEKRNLPILGICFGMQILNVARGGSLIQDIPSQVENAINHQQGIPRERNSHSIRIESGSLIEELANSKTDVMVNSHHHQAVKVMGESLYATSWTSDGVIESVEDKRPDKNVLGVQWHPELSWESDPVSRAIFMRFVETCNVKIQAAQ